MRCERVDLGTHYNEPDYIVSHQVDSAIHNIKRCMKVIFVNMDVFVHLSYHFVNGNWSDIEVYQEDVSAGK